MYIILGIVALVLLWVVMLYNGLVKLTNRAKEAWADIEVQLRRRYDLIPNLVESVKGYMQHERGTFEKVTAARTAAMQAESSSLADRGKAENILSGTLKTLFAVAENYPDLKANTNFLELQRELADTENKIQASRRFYNGNVRDLSIKIESFPNNLIANKFGFKTMEFFNNDEADASVREPVKVKF
ncbi:MAG: LemA protein [Parcubacteria group bacterium Gr01-1014_48]|nr:MAG: LemA protein [Parcubacteria group bacterium Greene0416_14]TSC74274.1 MAG: LemA protein [Parcubacteria group bacterium Gr01-1014_48]TSD01371.1 MAG: LemA protein [Parcubacteria group bacterium Greene1014_15]TSD08290.1 MAG: LemA protein [Parcubacteria group bacterium Greene0714_4]